MSLFARYVEPAVLTLARLNALGAAACAFTDSAFAIKGSSDPTKKALFEVDGFTTATSRTFTLPNVTSTLAVLGLAQTFSALQTFSSGIDSTSIGATTRGTGLFTTLGVNGQFTSTLSTGTAPFVVASTTNVANLNASSLSGATFAAPGAIGSGTPSTGAFTTLSATGAITSTLSTGTAPFTVASTTVVGNLNVSQLLGSTWAAPGTIGSGTPSTGAFTTLSATGVITSTLSTGTAPFTVASTTNVANLNASTLSGKTHADPGPIGSGTPSTGAFTTLSASDVITSTLATGTAPFTVASTTVVGNLNVSQLLGSTWAIPGSIGATTPAAGAFTTLSASSTLLVTGGATFSTLTSGRVPFVTTAGLLTDAANLTYSSSGAGLTVTSTGTAGGSFRISDSGTTSIAGTITCYHRSSGTPAAGFGNILSIGCDSSTNSLRNICDIQTTWVDATDATRKGRVKFFVYDTSARLAITTEAGGSAAMLGFYSAAAVVQPAGTGETVGFTAGGGTNVTDSSTFTGNVGSTAYRISDIVKALKNLGLLTQ